MSNETAKILLRVSAKILEDMAYLTPMPTDSATGLVAPPQSIVQCSFSGIAEGYLAIEYSGTFASIVAANMLGVEEDDPEADAKGQDAMKELANMLCGNVLPEIWGTQAIFTLGMPEICPPGSLAPPKGSVVTEERVALDIEGEFVTLVLTTA